MNINEKAIVTILVTFLVVIGAGMLFVQMTKPTAEEVIQQAKEYRSQGACGHAMTHAVHRDTGATYTCSTTCLAPGWEEGGGR